MATASPGDVTPAAGGDRAGQPQFRYPAVLALMFVTVVFLIGAPNTDISRAIAIAMVGGALVLTVATSRARESIRRTRAIVVGVVVGGTVVLIAVGAAPLWLSATVAIFVT
ncbi:MAG: hypothetical protein WBQ18_17835, partial [Solirubrobacteraceae bacterium]